MFKLKNLNNPRKNQERFLREAQSLAYFWRPKTEAPNIGDYLALCTVQFMLSIVDRHVLDKENKKQKLLSIGSVLHFANNGDCLWGTGRNGKVEDKLHTFSKLDVRSVRGPLTRQYLLEKGIPCPEIYGDPAILAPLMYPESIMCPTGPSQDVVIVSQLNDDLSFYNGYEKLLVSPRLYPGDFIKEILKAKTIVSSSLHGIILAEAYGRNAIFLDSGSGETQFKYDDYYQGTGRKTYHITSKIDEAIKLVSTPIPELFDRQQALIKVFPNDLWIR